MSEAQEWPESIGLVDAAAGERLAGEARERLLDVAREAFQHHVGMDLAALITRTQALHDATFSQCQAGNPHAVFTLLRALAEHCAAIEFMIDKPEAARAMWEHDGRGVQVGRLVNHAKRAGRAPNFGQIYGVLSQYAHPTATSYWSAWKVEDGEERTISWSSYARFRSDDDELTAWGWLIELTDGATKLLRLFARQA